MALFVAQLTGWLLPTPEDLGLNPVIGHLFTVNSEKKRQKEKESVGTVREEQ